VNFRKLDVNQVAIGFLALASPIAFVYSIDSSPTFSLTSSVGGVSHRRRNLHKESPRLAGIGDI
jgi:hypothetical protein